MKNTFGQSVTVTLFGESHGAEIGAVVDGLAPGISVDEAFIRHQLSLRRPMKDGLSTSRAEADPFRRLRLCLRGGAYQGKRRRLPRPFRHGGDGRAYRTALRGHKKIQVAL